jgi:hypothetical protein
MKSESGPGSNEGPFIGSFGVLHFHLLTPSGQVRPTPSKGPIGLYSFLDSAAFSKKYEANPSRVAPFTRLLFDNKSAATTNRSIPPRNMARFIYSAKGIAFSTRT